MNIDSEYIQKKEFHTTFKGYNMEEVDKFLDILAVEFDRLIKKNRDLQENLDKSNFENTVNEEDTSRLVSEVLLSAHKIADEIKKKAEDEAMTILEERKNAEEIKINNLVERKKIIDDQLEQSQNAYNKFLKDIKAILSDFSTRIDGLQPSLTKEEVDEKAEEPVGSDINIKQTDHLKNSTEEEAEKDPYYLKDEERQSTQEKHDTMVEMEEDKKIRDFIESGTTENDNKIYTEENFQGFRQQAPGKKIFDEIEEEKIYKEKRNPDIANPDIIDEFFGDHE